MNRTSKDILQAQPEEADGYVFHDDAGHRLLPDRISREIHWVLSWAQKAGEIGTAKRLHFHSLRHLFATWLLEQGEEIKHVRDLLGHYSIKTTQIYVHLPKEALRKTVKNIDIPYAKVKLAQ